MKLTEPTVEDIFVVIHNSNTHTHTHTNKMTDLIQEKDFCSKRSTDRRKAYAVFKPDGLS